MRSRGDKVRGGTPRSRAIRHRTEPGSGRMDRRWRAWRSRRPCSRASLPTGQAPAGCLTGGTPLLSLGAPLWRVSKVPTNSLAVQGAWRPNNPKVWYNLESMPGPVMLNPSVSQKSDQIHAPTKVLYLRHSLNIHISWKTLWIVCKAVSNRPKDLHVQCLLCGPRSTDLSIAVSTEVPDVVPFVSPVRGSIR